jgi:molybdenum cofactor cytidylyltransferase
LSKLAVLILAAGNSSRMGTPKQLLKWKETNLLQHTINTVNELNLDVVFVVLGAHYNTILEQVNVDSATVVYNPNWEAGIGNSIAFGVNKINKLHPEIEGILITLSDQPLINSSYLKTIVENYYLHHRKIVCTLYQNKKLGVPAIFNQIYFEALKQLNHDKGAKNLLSKYSSQISYLDGMDVISDIDTKEDYKKLYNKYH